MINAIVKLQPVGVHLEISSPDIATTGCLGVSLINPYHKYLLDHRFFIAVPDDHPYTVTYHYTFNDVAIKAGAIDTVDTVYGSSVIDLGDATALELLVYGIPRDY